MSAIIAAFALMLAWVLQVKWQLSRAEAAATASKLRAETAEKLLKQRAQLDWDLANINKDMANEIADINPDVGVNLD